MGYTLQAKPPRRGGRSEQSWYESAMNHTTPDRIVELWPHLSPEARDKLIEFAESVAEEDRPLDLTADDEAAIEQARLDFTEGRTVSFDEFCADLDSFMATLCSKTRAAP